ncbi:MAG: ornithine cyclodeaminase family protein [Desulfobacula sp.]|jgi:ornithine cyclodeaminase/alanine dehydrogenase-like protein (mu-crystallin family)|uniref:ornithine cyclodeaminase family protein n=1 Tax=Desulfobacula sp. TaxID=2593537 RepID=UPI001D220E52|nr:ornithine cyclodeaminase family protein [Desulfobacula sp.]MBT3483879.1 ornithine cyclodeaminase family protein [Desulfobacula sp.]MBT3803067.1 ornithine cyclodeaminase family protein [Desulfobacula sp.]MBT4023420.1 ornithine cyclodeaminase family protein [Desulfobacula sp.]MBT4197115.1 ornithine cyclodeaminase family protein [Desulfobacula sp.]
MEIISENQVKQLLPADHAIEVVEQAFKDYSKNVISMGKRGTLDVDSNGDACIFLPAVHKRKKYYSMKYAASFPSCGAKGLPTVQSVIWIFSAETGNVCAMIQANALTAIKTGAASAVATRYLAKKDAGVLTIIGAGNQAQMQLACISQVRDLKEIRLVDLNLDKCENLKNWTIKNLDLCIPIIMSSTADEAVKYADIIVTCTTSSRPVLKGELIKPGTHINAIGSFTPEMQEIDAQTVLRSDKIITDAVKETWNCAGDLIVPVNKGLIPRTTAICELGDIIEKKITGRSSNEEITLYESVGFAPLDLAVGIETFQRLKSSLK